MDLEIDGETALVAASSSGLGKGAAESLVREGANVVVNGRDEDRLAEAVADIQDVGPGDVVGQPGDLTDPDDVAALVDRAVSEFGGLDHLVTNAGDPTRGRFDDLSDDDWYDAFDLLVMSVVRLVREAKPHLREREGTVTAITSITLKQPVETLALSSSVRLAVQGLTKTLATDLGPEVRVNSVLPGPIETPALRDIVERAVAEGEYDSYEEGLASYWPEGTAVERIGTPRELGDAVAFLASDRAGYVTGEALLVEGGAVRTH